MSIVDTIVESYANYWSYLVSEISFDYDYKPWWQNYFWMLVTWSVLLAAIEVVKPWRKNQPLLRKQFWLDVFYMFFNFFLFSLIIWEVGQNVVVDFFNTGLKSLFGIDNIIAFNIQKLSFVSQLIIAFVLRDFIQWWTHRLLHYVPFLWKFHKVHHSVEEMGFAAHLRYHWMENVVYKSIEYLPLAFLGIDLGQYFILHTFTVLVGHFNHANFKMNLGPLKYVFNNPQMHIWHHAKKIPESHPHGINFGLTLSCWDYIFGTNYIPHEGKDIELGFIDVEKFPKKFMKQVIYGFKKD